MAAKNILVQTRLKPALYDKIKWEADAHGLSVASYLRMLLHELTVQTTKPGSFLPARAPRRAPKGRKA